MRWLLTPTESRIRVESKRFLAGERCPYTSNRKHLRRAQLPRNDCDTGALPQVHPKDRGWLPPQVNPRETRHDYDAGLAGTR
jgi:hypothetical protein